jgi:hypothetical protein
MLASSPSLPSSRSNLQALLGAQAIINATILPKWLGSRASVVVVPGDAGVYLRSSETPVTCWSSEPLPANVSAQTISSTIHPGSSSTIIVPDHRRQTFKPQKCLQLADFHKKSTIIYVIR